MYSYKTRGTCSRNIDFKIIDGKVQEISFMGGCDGNLKGIAQLAEGRSADDVVKALEGITCGRKSTSCPDQLAQAVRAAMECQAAN